MKVLLIAASTVCGRISPAGMGSMEDRRFLERMRVETDASLIGAGTLRAENPEMSGPDGVIAGRLRAIVTSSGNIPVDKKIFSQAPEPLVFTKEAEMPALQQRLLRRARVIGLPAGPHGVSIGAVLEKLREFGAESVLLEGGAGLNYLALQEGVVDELFLTLAPSLSGDRAAVSLVEGDGPLGRPFLAMHLLACRVAQESGEIFLHYTLR